MAVFSFSSNIGNSKCKENDNDTNEEKGKEVFIKKNLDIDIPKVNKSHDDLKVYSEDIKEQSKEESKEIYADKLRRISGVAFLDKFYDSTYYKFSIGINNIELNLYDEDDNLLSVTKTKKFMHIDGYFEFNNLYPGKYKIEIISYENLFISPQILNEYYGSKANPKSNLIIFNISERNIFNAFIGFYKYV